MVCTETAYNLDRNPAVDRLAVSEVGVSSDIQTI